MGLPMLSGFCFGLSLKTGTIILAIVTVVLGMYMAAVGILEETIHKGDSVGMRVITITSLLLGGLVIIVGLLTCCAAIWSVASLLYPYLVLSVFLTSMCLISLTLRVLYHFKMDKELEGVLLSLYIALMVLLQFYFFLIVYSLFRQLREEGMIYDDWSP